MNSRCAGRVSSSWRKCVFSGVHDFRDALWSAIYISKPGLFSQIDITDYIVELCSFVKSRQRSRDQNGRMRGACSQRSRRWRPAQLDGSTPAPQPPGAALSTAPRSAAARRPRTRMGTVLPDRHAGEIGRHSNDPRSRPCDPRNGEMTFARSVRRSEAGRTGARELPAGDAESTGDTLAESVPNPRPMRCANRKPSGDIHSPTNWRVRIEAAEVSGRRQAGNDSTGNGLVTATIGPSEGATPMPLSTL